MGGAEHSRRAAVRRSRAHRKLAAGGGGADHAGAAARSPRAMKFADCLFWRRNLDAGLKRSRRRSRRRRVLRRKASTRGAKPFRSEMSLVEIDAETKRKFRLRKGKFRFRTEKFRFAKEKRFASALAS